jgi:hypothetical protein
MWTFINDQLFKMVWLNDLAGWFVETIFKLPTDEKIGGSLQFFIFDTVKIFILLSVLIFCMGIIQSYFHPNARRCC